MDPVVAHVTHAAQNDALRKAPGPPVVACPELPQHGNEGVAHQRVDLVDQQHEGTPIGRRPAGQGLAERAGGPGPGQDAGPDPVEESVAQRRARAGRHLVQDGPHRLLQILARGLGGFDVGIDAAQAARAAVVEQIPQRQQDGRLARLAGRVEHEVALLADELQDSAQIDPFERRNAVVVRGDDGPLGVEEAHRGQYDSLNPAGLDAARGVPPPAAGLRRGPARGYTRIVTRTYVAVLVVQAVVLAALWLLGRHFAA